MHGRDFWNEATNILRGLNRHAEQERIIGSIDNATEGAAPAFLEEDSDESGNQPTGRGGDVDQGDQVQPSEAPEFGLEGQTLDEVGQPVVQKAPSVLRASKRAHEVEFPGGFDAPTANRITAGLFANLGASATNHVVVESFYKLPEQVQAYAHAQGNNENTNKGLYHGGTDDVVSGNHKPTGDLEDTVFKETIVHKGMRKQRGSAFV